jgi:hypothetical protein
MKIFFKHLQISATVNKYRTPQIKQMLLFPELKTNISKIS